MSINTGNKEIGKLVENKIKMLLQQSKLCYIIAKMVEKKNKYKRTKNNT